MGKGHGRRPEKGVPKPARGRGDSQPADDADQTLSHDDQTRSDATRR